MLVPLGTPPKNMTIEKQPFGDVSSIKKCDVSLLSQSSWWFQHIPEILVKLNLPQFSG